MPEEATRIAYQGEPGAFSEAAAMRLSGAAELLPCRSFEDVFASVNLAATSHGVLPIENSIGGSIHRNYDLLLEHDLPIVGEVEIQVVHHLLAMPGVSRDRLRRVYSHPQGLAQCERFLRTLTGVEIIATYDTAGSAKLVADERLQDAAAIASARAGEVFGLTPLASGIQDFDDNLTRFIVIGRRPIGPAVADKTTIMFSVPDEPGSLFKALSVFALRNIDLMKLESRPIPGRPWEYLFYADLAAGSEDPPCARALTHLAEFASTLRTLGSYPRWKRRDSGLPDPFDVVS
jgi:arogenate/prephenate dehydratase